MAAKVARNICNVKTVKSCTAIVAALSVTVKAAAAVDRSNGVDQAELNMSSQQKTHHNCSEEIHVYFVLDFKQHKMHHNFAPERLKKCHSLTGSKPSLTDSCAVRQHKRPHIAAGKSTHIAAARTMGEQRRQARLKREKVLES